MTPPSSNTLTKTGTGTLTLTASNTYTGATIINNGQLVLSGAGALSDFTAVSVTSNTAIFDISAITAGSETIGSLAGVSGSSVLLGTKNLTVGGNNTSTNFAGVLSGVGGSLTKIGTGTQTLSGTNTYTGATTVSEGNLQVGSGGAGSTHASSAVSINGITAILSGTGTVNGATTVTLGKISPGDSDGVGIGTLNTGDVILTGAASAETRMTLQTAMMSASSINDAAGISAAQAGGTLPAYFTANAAAYELESGSHDKLNITGALNLNTNGRILLDNTLGYTFAFGDVFDLIDWTAIGNINLDGDGGAGYAAFDVNTDLDMPSLGAGLAFDRSLFATNGIIVVIPEPSRVLLLMFGLASLLLRRRREGK